MNATKFLILGVGQRLLTYDYGSVNSENVTKDTILMGTDSSPLSILSMHYIDNSYKMYRLTTVQGDTLLLGEDHVLKLKCSYRNTKYFSKRSQKYIVEWEEDGRKRSKSFFKEDEADQFLLELNESKGQIYEITVEDFVCKTDTWKDRYAICKGFLEHPEIDVDLDPYYVGLWLGDGSIKETAITNIDKPVIDYIYQFAEFHGLKVTRKDDYTYRLASKVKGAGTNPIINALKKYGIFDNKRIPREYLKNSRKVRLGVLAGFIDSDGNYSNNRYRITQCRKDLALDLLFLCRSLGFAATYHPCDVPVVVSGGGTEIRTYHTVNISGENMEDIPILIDRKKAIIQTRKRAPLYHKFKLEEVETSCMIIEVASEALADNFLIL